MDSFQEFACETQFATHENLELFFVFKFSFIYYSTHHFFSSRRVQHFYMGQRWRRRRHTFPDNVFYLGNVNNSFCDEQYFCRQGLYR